MIDFAFIHNWAPKYPAKYDDQGDFASIEDARKGDHKALRKVTEWKNVGYSGQPMHFSKHRQKEAVFQFFLRGLPKYLRPEGSAQLRKDFARRAPVWSIFWHHILYGTPIFDVYTHMAWHWDLTGIILSKKDATICAPAHWPTYDRYCVWFRQTLERLLREDAQITERLLDRALFMWGQSQE